MPFYKYNEKSRKKEAMEPIKRYSSLKELNADTKYPQTSVDDSKDSLIEHITNTQDMRQRLGIIMGEGGKIPSTVDMPRIFLIRPDENGVDRISSLDEAGISYGSRAFWKEAQLGRVFAYPVGEKNPVQLNLNVRESTVRLNFSKPLEPAEIPLTAAQPKRPGFFQRVLHSIRKSWASPETRKYYSRPLETKAIRDRLQAVSEERAKTVSGEMKQLQDHEAVLEAEAKRKDAINHAKDMELDLHEKKHGLRTYKELSAPKPIFNESIEKISGEEKSQSGLYSKEDFAMLKSFDAKISDFSVGGQPLSEEEYMGLMAAVSTSTKYTEDAMKASPEPDDTLIPTLQRMGFSKEQVLQDYSYLKTDWLFGDYMKIRGLRDGETNYFKPVINPAKEDTLDLLKRYQNGDPGAKKEMAEHITRGMTHIINSLQDKDKVLSDSFMKQCRVMNALANLMDRDPEIKKIAMAPPPQGCGLKQEALDVVRGMEEMDKADIKAAESALKLANAQLDGAVPLTEEEKKACAQDIVASKLMQEQLFDNVRKIKNDPEHSKITKEIQDIYLETMKNGRTVTKEHAEAWKKVPGSRPMPPEGKLFSDQIGDYRNMLERQCNKIPEVAQNLGKPGAVQQYRDLSKDIVEKEGFGKMSLEDLNKKLTGNTPEISGKQLVLKGEAVIRDKQAAAMNLAQGPAAEASGPVKAGEGKAPQAEAGAEQQKKNEQPAGLQP